MHLQKVYEDNDIDALMALFADDAVYLEGRGMNDGKRAIRDDHLGGHFASTTYLRYEARDRVISGHGAVAYVHQMVTRQQQANNSDTPSELRVTRVLYVLEKSNGSWLIALPTVIVLSEICWQLLKDPGDRRCPVRIPFRLLKPGLTRPVTGSTLEI